MKGNFQSACKRIAEKIFELNQSSNPSNPNEDCLIMWLEDDWKLKQHPIDINTIIRYIMPWSYINLSYIRANYIWALAPSIISYKLWKLIHYDGWMNETKKIDPEHSLGVWYTKKFQKEERIVNLSVFYNINTSQLKRDYLKRDKSYYTYLDDIPMDKRIINPKYITFEDFKQKYSDIHVFIRFSLLDSIGVNYGRNYMENFKIFKIGKNDTYNENFYICKNN